MRRIVIIAAILGIAGWSCRKDVPTVLIRAVSEYRAGRYDTSTEHFVWMFGIYPYDTPRVSINGYPVDIYSAWMDGYFVWDSVPPVSPGQEVELNLQFKDLNGSDREASAVNEVPPVPKLTLVSIDSMYMTVSWESPDPEKVDFVLFHTSITCRDTGWNFESGEYDTLISDPGINTVEVYVPRACSPYPVPIAHTHAYFTLSFVSAPWSGEGDNVKGAKGQYFAMATTSDTVSWNRDTTAAANLPIPKHDPWGIYRLLNKYFGSPYGE